MQDSIAKEKKWGEKMSGNFAIKGGGVGPLMANAILNFHFDFLTTSLSKHLEQWTWIFTIFNEYHFLQLLFLKIQNNCFQNIYYYYCYYKSTTVTIPLFQHNTPIITLTSKHLFMHNRHLPQLQYFVSIISKLWV